MAIEYKCSKHGVLSPAERCVWVKDASEKRWCRHCIDEMMDKFCGIIEIKEK